jgi:hypothetical protein
VPAPPLVSKNIQLRRSELYADLQYAHNIGRDSRRTEFGQVGYRFSW